MIFVFSIAVTLNIPINTRWADNGLSIAGGLGKGDGLNQLHFPCGIYVDDEQTVYIADKYKHQIM